MIAKTTAEARRIPTIEENVTALTVAAVTAERTRSPVAAADTGLLVESRTLVDAVRGIHPDLGHALVKAFERGWLDVPFCLHPDNPGCTRSHIADDGWLRWSSIGALPIRSVVGPLPWPGEHRARGRRRWSSCPSRGEVTWFA